MSFIYERVKRMTDEIASRLNRGANVPVEGLEYCETGYKNSNVPAKGLRWIQNAESIPMGLNGKEEHVWMRGKLVIPDELIGKKLSLVDTSITQKGWNRSPQILIYIDGKMEGAFDQHHSTCDIDSSVKEHDLVLYCYVNENAKVYNVSVAIHEELEEINQLYYDITVPLRALEFIDKNSKTYNLVLNTLNEALDIVDFTKDGDEFMQSCFAASAFLKENLYEKYKNDEAACVCIGHSHIDVAWLWTFAQTREKVQRTFSTVVRMMKKYPEYKFMASQAQLYKFCKEDAPELYNEICGLIKEGRWEVEGSTWVEMDTNITGGESLVRQFIYGKRFFNEEFGVETKTLWLPDCFGYSAALPQILKKSGVDYFVTSKLSWNETNEFPYDCFKWKGIDGTAVNAYLLTACDKKRNGFYTSYNADITPSMMAGAYDRFHQKDLSDEVLITFGHGDGGGGPTDQMIETGMRLRNGLPEIPAVKFEFAGQFLKELFDKNEFNKNMPEWNGELYLEFHRGTYTSQAKNKKNNRKSEILYHNAELLSTIAETKLGIGYPTQKLRENWEKILLCQFHDVLPGSSIGPVYKDTDEIYKGIIGDGKGIVESIYAALAKEVKTYGGLLVFNPNAFEASVEIFAEGEWRYVEKIPSLGWAVVTPADKVVPKVGDRKMENDFVRVEFDEYMNISRIYDKVNGREVLKAGRVGCLEAFEDYPREYDAWEITDYYKDKRFDVNNVVSVERYECGEKAGFIVTRTFRDSVIKQTITLDGHTPNITFDNDIDWNNDHVLLKARYPFDLNTTSASYDIQFGYITRPTHTNTSWDKAKFEVCGQKYADVSEHGYGVSIINDCKYGYSAEGSELSITLLKSATSPDPMADKCKHEFTYVLYPHKGDFVDAKTIENAYIVNNPMVCVPVSRQDGKLTDKFSFVSVSGDGVIVETVKKAENGEGYIVRLYDSANTRSTKTLRFGVPVKEVYVCDLLENELEKVETEYDEVKLEVKPFEIVTLKIKC